MQDLGDWAYDVVWEWGIYGVIFLGALVWGVGYAVVIALLWSIVGVQRAWRRITRPHSKPRKQTTRPAARPTTTRPAQQPNRTRSRGWRTAPETSQIPATCPTPLKMSMETKAQALRQVERVARKYGDQQRPYLCRCGRWHLTTMSEARYKKTQGY